MDYSNNHLRALFSIVLATVLLFTTQNDFSAARYEGIGGMGPFGIHARGSYDDVVYEDFGLWTDHRTILTANTVFGDPPITMFGVQDNILTVIATFDQEILTEAREGIVSKSVVTLVSKMTSTEFGIDYILPEGHELELWKDFVAFFVERYDGDNDFGCRLPGVNDCYFAIDGAYPDGELQAAIMSNPIKHWQIEQEWMHSIYVEKDDKRKLADGPTLDAHFDVLHGVIKGADPEAYIISGAMNPFKGQMLLEGYIGAGFFEQGDDCTYESLGPDFMQTLTPGEIKIALDYDEKFNYLMQNTIPKSDIVDFHLRVRQDPYLLKEMVQYLRDKMPPDAQTEIWGLEISGPFYYFPLLGIDPPGLTDPGYCNELTNMAPYDIALQSSYLMKIHVIGYAAGMNSIFYASGTPEPTFLGQLPTKYID